jgi:hypothetical protein
MDLWMDVMDDGDVLMAMDWFDFYCLLKGWGGLDYIRSVAGLYHIVVSYSFFIKILLLFLN